MEATRLCVEPVVMHVERCLSWDGIKRDESGYILILSLFVLVMVSVIGVGLAVVGLNEYTLSARTKLMDKAYSIAEAGINRATVQLKLDTSLTTSTHGDDHRYMQTGCTPQWPLGDVAGVTEAFGGTGYSNGSYTVTMWQSERTTPANETINPQYKVIRATGSLTQGGMTAERTIEARIVSGPMSTQYDASFDYCIYNGYNQENGMGTWPPGGQRSWFWNNMIIDGYTPYAGHYPKGAIYTKGNIDLPVVIGGHYTIQGNVVATNNITLRNSWSADFLSPGIKITKGNVVAGLNRDHLTDDTDNNNAHVLMAAAMGTQSLLTIYGDGVPGKGFVVAAKDVDVSSIGTVSFGSPPRIGVNPSGATEGGVKAGRDVTIGGSVNIGAGLSIGNIVSGRRTAITSTFGGGISVNQIQAGQHPTNGEGVNMYTGLSAINTGAITSRGKVVGSPVFALINTGNVTCGNDLSGDSYGGTAMGFWSWFGVCGIGNIQRYGSLDIQGWVSVGNISNAPAKPAAPTVDVLAAADLTETVNLIEPVWTYFEQQANSDDISNGPNTKRCPNPACEKTVTGDGGSPPGFPNNCPYCSTDITTVPTGPAHVVRDRKYSYETKLETGDWDDNLNNNTIYVRWDTTKPYSSNETIYNGDPSSVVILNKMNWSDKDNQVFEGTVVSKGDVRIEASAGDWFIGTNNTLNVCSGNDILRNSSAISLWEEDESHFHFWAKRNIDLTNIGFSGVSNGTLYGSFTAGNRVSYSNSSFISNTTFRWSRWPLPAQAWVSPVRVLSWKEI